jgi:lipopolysaccharide export LptBFGC system permease protein LptF
MREMSKAGTLDPLFGAHAVNLLFLAIGFWLLNRNRAL